MPLEKPCRQGSSHPADERSKHGLGPPPTIDEEVAERLVRVGRAVQLLGCACIVTGISPRIARMFVDLGINLEHIKPLRSLKQGIKHCMAARQASDLRSIPALNALQAAPSM